MSRSIYVVDDQPQVMEAVVFALRNLGRDWEVTGFNEPLSALAAVKARAPDAVLSDQSMPGMQGSEMLEQVRIISPTTLRLIMSGCVPLDKLTLITSAHQYLAKPFDAVQLRNIIQRSFAAQERMLHQGLRSVVTSIRSIPSLPQAHHSLLAELKDSRNASSTIARLIGGDPGLSVKVLQLSNSSLFGQGSLVTSLIDAVNCLGTDMIAAIVLAQSIFRHYESLQHREIDLLRVWAHCWETASLAQRLCREKKLPAKTGEEAFLAGLLHEVGRFILIDNFADQYQAACDNARRSKIPLAASLRQGFQTSPFQLSAYVLELWGLPQSLIASIAFQDNPEQDPARSFSMTSALYVADHLASRDLPPDSFALEDWNTGYLQSIGCADDVPDWEKLSMPRKTG